MTGVGWRCEDGVEDHEAMFGHHGGEIEDNGVLIENAVGWG